MKLALFGARGHGKVIADLAESLGYEPCFFDDTFPSVNRLEGWKVVGDFSALVEARESFPDVAISIGNNEVRHRIYSDLKNRGFNLPTLVHPTAYISKYAKISDGCVVLANSVAGSFVRIGEGGIVNNAAVVEHDCDVGRFVHICPNATLAGGVVIGEFSWIGMSACVKQLVKVGQNAFIGAGSVVIRDVPTGVVVGGVPAAPLKK